MATQILDLRSATAKEAGIAIQLLAEAMSIDFEAVGYKLIGKDHLSKLMHSGTKILAEIGASALISIVMNVHSVKIIQRLNTELSESRSQYVYAKAATVIMIIMQYYPEDILEKLDEVLPQFLKSCLTNASPECRQIARKAFLIWQKID